MGNENLTGDEKVLSQLSTREDLFIFLLVKDQFIFQTEQFNAAAVLFLFLYGKAKVLFFRDMLRSNLNLHGSVSSPFWHC